MRKQLALVAAFVVAALSLSGPSSAALTGPDVGSAAPPFSLRTIDGRTVTLDSYRGKTLVLNVWATWCPPCRQETADLVKAYAILHKNNVEFLGIDTTEEAPIVRAFVAAKGVAYPQAIDREQTFAKAYDIRYFPTTLVIDPQGILRVRYIDVLGAGQLRSFAVSAAAGRNAAVESPLQAKIDALLAPAGFAFSGDETTIRAAVKASNEAIAKADALLDESDANKGLATDFLATHVAEAALRERAIAAFEPLARSEADRAMLARMRGDAAAERERWIEAIASYEEALAIDAKDKDALGGLASAAGAASVPEKQLGAFERLVALDPTNVDTLIELGAAYTKAKDFAKAEDANRRAIEAATAALAREPGVPARIRKVAATHLFAGRTFARAGDRRRAHEEFTALTQWTLKLPKDDVRYAMYLEEAQEADLALELGESAVAGATSVSLAPWTGPDLPGSIPNTIKLRLLVAAAAGKSVALRAADVPKGWVASFCTDRVCAPFKLSVTVPASGVKVIEFQLVPNDARTPKQARVRVIARDGNATTSASASVVASR